MAINIIVSDLVRFKVTGTLNNDQGQTVPFDFWLVMERLKDAAAVQEYWHGVQTSESASALIDALQAKARGWSGVFGNDGQSLDFGPDAMRTLLSMPGMAFIVNSAYLRESGAKEKN